MSHHPMRNKKSFVENKHTNKTLVKNIAHSFWHRKVDTRKKKRVAQNKTLLVI